MPSRFFRLVTLIFCPIIFSGHGGAQSHPNWYNNQKKCSYFCRTGEKADPITQKTKRPTDNLFFPKLSGYPKVTDGDTIKMGSTRIRLYGIDAPESNQLCILNNVKWRCGHASKMALKKVIGESMVYCNQSNQDRYGRAIATCHSEGTDLNAWMVLNGWAVAYQQYSAKLYSS